MASYPYCGSHNVSETTVTHRDGDYIHYSCEECGRQWES